jgi:spermidine synthase
MVKKHLAAKGLMVVQSTSPFFAPHAYWTIDATLREVGMRTYPTTPTCPRSANGALSSPRRSRLQPPTTYRLPMRYLNADTTREMFIFPPDMQPCRWRRTA